MSDANPEESLDTEGMPESDGQPGKDVETSEEWVMAPRDHPVASGSDPVYPVTADEQRAGETVAERAARELPDFGEAPANTQRGIGGRLMEPDSDIEEIDLTKEEVALLSEDTGSQSAEEDAVHVIDDPE